MAKQAAKNTRQGSTGVSQKCPASSQSDQAQDRSTRPKFQSCLRLSILIPISVVPALVSTKMISVPGWNGCSARAPVGYMKNVWTML